MRIRNLKNHRYANCGHYVDGINGEEGFISYNTKVIIIRHGRVIYTGKYSSTTTRQLSWWLEEHEKDVWGLNKKTLAIMYKEHLAYNACTGALEPLTKDEEQEIAEIRYETRIGY
jgi:hypothetical protein